MAGWPWPLDGVQNWFESLWNGILGWVNSAAAWMTEHVFDPLARWFSGLWSTFYSAAREGFDLTERLLAGVAEPWRSVARFFLMPFAFTYTFLKPVITWVWDKVKPGIEAIQRSLEGVGKAVYDALPQPLKDFIRWIGEMGRALWDGLNSFVKDPVGTLKAGWDMVTASVGKAVGDIGAAISGAVGGAVDILSVAFNGAVSTIGGWVSGALAGVAGALGEALSGFMTWITGRLQWLAQSIVGVANAVKDAVVGFFEWVGRSLVAMVTTIFSPHSPKREIQQETETAFQSMIKEIEKLTTLPRRSQPPYEALATAVVSVASRFLMLKLGVEGVGAAIDAAHPIKGLKAHEIAAGLIGIVDMPSVIGPLLQEPIRQGIMIPWQHYWASRYTPQIPGPGDLIRFVVREVIDVDTFRSNMAFQGYSAFWSDAYWEAHWELPSRSEILEAFHRGVLSEAEKDKFMVWHDYKPEPRPGISKSDLEILKGIEKTLIGRVDLRRGYELGALTKEDLIERFRWLGYEDDAELMAELQIRQALDAEIGKLRDNAKSDFVKGYITEQDLRGTLKTLGYGADLVEFYVQDAVQDRERARKDMLVSNYVDAYVKGLIETEDELAQCLSTVIVDPQLVQVKVEDAYIARYKKPKGG